MNKLQGLFGQGLHFRLSGTIEAIEQIKYFKTAELAGVHAKSGHAFGDYVGF